MSARPQTGLCRAAGQAIARPTTAGPRVAPVRRRTSAFGCRSLVGLRGWPIDLRLVPRVALALVALVALVGPADPATAALAAEGRVLTVGPSGDHTALAAALEAARDGDTVRVRGGVHRGPFVVTRAVALEGADGAVLDGGGEDTVITFEADGGRLSGFTVRASGTRSHREDSGLLAEGTITVADNRFEDVLYGINIKGGPDSVVVDNVVYGRDIHVARRGDGIRLWESPGARVERNRVIAGRDVVIWYSEDITIRDNLVREGRYGLHYMYSHDSRIEGNRFVDNSVGAFLMYSTDLSLRENVFAGNHGPSGYGLALKDSDTVAVVDNVFAGNRVGLYLDNSPTSRESHNTVRGNAFAYNDVGLMLLPSVERNRVGANNFIENVEQVAIKGRAKQAAGNDWSPGGAGNFWSNYAGYDADGDGFGDLPYRDVSLFQSLLGEHPVLRLFTLSPAERAIDLAARAFPVFEPPPTLVDTAPRMRPVPAAVPAPAPARGPLGLAALAMVAAAALVGAWGARLDRPQPAVTLERGPSAGAVRSKT